jgi:hypothetical protein
MKQEEEKTAKAEIMKAYRNKKMATIDPNEDVEDLGQGNSHLEATQENLGDTIKVPLSNSSDHNKAYRQGVQPLGGSDKK